MNILYILWQGHGDGSDPTGKLRWFDWRVRLVASEAALSNDALAAAAHGSTSAAAPVARVAAAAAGAPPASVAPTRTGWLVFAMLGGSVKQLSWGKKISKYENKIR